MTRPEDLLHNRELWDLVNDQFSGADGLELWGWTDIAWGLFATPESQVQVLGDVAGLDVVELGCGTAHVSAWLARRGARMVAIDQSGAQLASARQAQAQHGMRFPLRAGRCRERATRLGLCRPRDQRARRPRVVRARRLDRRVRPHPASRGSTGVPHQQPAVSDVCPRRRAGLPGRSCCAARMSCARSAGRVAAWSTIRATASGSGCSASTGSSSSPCASCAPRLDHDPGRAAVGYYDIADLSWARRWPAEDLWSARLAG